jgi:hypothetical protein
MKTCTGCKIEKSLDEFYRWRQANDGRMARCKLCTRDRMASKARCVDCGGKVSHARVQRCQSCNAVHKRTYSRIIKDGYVMLSGMQDHPNARHGKLFEHTKIMSEHLGRPLLGHEEVHHKNGVRDDNRLSNLELWSKSQPAGQRVEDKADWAIEILKLYRPEVLK